MVFRLKLDKIDLSILNMLYTVEEKMPVWDMCKDIFPDEKRSELQKLDTKIRKRLEKLERYGLVNSDKEDGRQVFSINKGRENNVICAHADIDIHPKGNGLPDRDFRAKNLVLITNPDGIYLYSFIPMDIENVDEE